MTKNKDQGDGIVAGFANGGKWPQAKKCGRLKNSKKGRMDSQQSLRKEHSPGTPWF